MLGARRSALVAIGIAAWLVAGPARAAPPPSIACDEQHPPPPTEGHAFFGASMGYSRLSLIDQPDATWEGLVFGMGVGATLHGPGIGFLVSFTPFELSLVGPGLDDWFLELVQFGVYHGVEVGPLTMYGGLTAAWVGIDHLGDEPLASVFNPRGTAGIELLAEPIMVRTAFNLGRMLRLPDDSDVQMMTAIMTVGFVPVWDELGAPEGRR